MTVAYYLLETAQRDLQGIWRYYDRLGGEQLAQQQITDLHLRFELLSDFPYLGRERPELIEGIRSFVSSSPSYTILYFPLEDWIEIAHVLHGSQDLEMLFGQSP